MNTLLELGYQREDVVYALRVTANDVELACSFLLSNPHLATDPHHSSQASARQHLSRRNRNELNVASQSRQSLPPHQDFLAYPATLMDAEYQYVVRPTGANRPRTQVESPDRRQEDEEEEDDDEEEND